MSVTENIPSKNSRVLPEGAVFGTTRTTIDSEFIELFLGILPPRQREFTKKMLADKQEPPLWRKVVAAILGIK